MLGACRSRSVISPATSIRRHRAASVRRSAASQQAGPPPRHDPVRPPVIRPQGEGILGNCHDRSCRAGLYLADISQLGHDLRVDGCLFNRVRQGCGQSLLEVIEFLGIDQKSEDRGFRRVTRVDHDALRNGDLVESGTCVLLDRLFDDTGDLRSRRSIPSAADEEKPLEIRIVQQLANVLQIARFYRDHGFPCWHLSAAISLVLTVLGALVPDFEGSDEGGFSSEMGPVFSRIGSGFDGR